MYDVGKIQQLSEWDLENKSKLNKNHVKVTQKLSFCWRFSVIFWAVVHFEYLPSVETDNKEYYPPILKSLRDAVHPKWLELWSNNSWILHDDNLECNKGAESDKFLGLQKSA